MTVNKNALLMRDNEGELLPMELDSPLFKGTVKVIPMSEGDFNKIKSQGTEANDDDIINKFLYEPKLTPEEVKTLPAISKREIVKLILMTSGLTREEIEFNLAKATEMMRKRLAKE